jgi:ribosome-associated protein
MAAKKKKAPQKKKKSLSGKKATPRAKAKSPARPRLVKRPPASPRPRKKLVRRTVVVLENKEGLALAQTIAGIALDKKALQVTILDVRQRASSVGYDYVVIASGDSDRQLWAISEAVREVVKPTGRRPSSVEASPDWVLLNYDDVVAHLFTVEKRDIYDLEGLWTDAPRVEVGSR